MAVDGWAVTGGDWAGSQLAQAPPRCTKCNSPTINGQCTSHLRSVNLASLCLLTYLFFGQ